jgi:zinc D-Ala-D-Ala dipeptidase
MKAAPQLISICLFFALAIPLVQGSGLFGSSSQSPVVKKAKRYHLVEVATAAPGIYVDLRYKFTSVAGKPLYLKDMPCLIHDATGKKLRAAQAEVAKQGYALKVWDAWRPPESHKKLWEAVKDPRYVVPPDKGLSWHCYGISIDLTLVNSDGSPLEMPTKFDVLTKEAASTYTGNDPEIKKNLAILQKAMSNAGFQKIKDEWWHFDDGASSRKVYNVTAKDLGIELAP